MKAKSGTVEPGRKIKGWKKEFGYWAVEPDGTIFLSWAHAGCSQMEVFLCAGYDREPATLIEDTPLYRAHWLSKEFPRMREIIDRAIKRIGEAHPSV
jgi:hypothetical protein